MIAGFVSIHSGLNKNLLNTSSTQHSINTSPPSYREKKSPFVIHGKGYDRCREAIIDTNSHLFYTREWARKRLIFCFKEIRLNVLPDLVVHICSRFHVFSSRTCHRCLNMLDAGGEKDSWIKHLLDVYNNKVFISSLVCLQGKFMTQATNIGIIKTNI